MIFLVWRIDKQDVAIEQALPALCLCGPPPACVVKFVRALDRNLHSTATALSQNDADGLLEPNNPCFTPQKVSSRRIAHDSGSIATPSLQWTCTIYSLPVSRRTLFRPRQGLNSFGVADHPDQSIDIGAECGFTLGCPVGHGGALPGTKQHPSKSATTANPRIRDFLAE
ncbi:hypothetical protein IVB04_08555 [Bradyrhizobium sp. 169]|nr:hypothetical protein [Bradyrhizobium sp. 169]